MARLRIKLERTVKDREGKAQPRVTSLDYELSDVDASRADEYFARIPHLIMAGEVIQTVRDGIGSLMDLRKWSGPEEAEAPPPPAFAPGTRFFKTTAVPPSPVVFKPGDMEAMGSTDPETGEYKPWSPDPAKLVEISEADYQALVAG